MLVVGIFLHHIGRPGLPGALTLHGALWGDPPCGDCVKTPYHHIWPLLSTLFRLQGKHSLASFVTDAKKKRRKPKSKKQESILLQSRLSSLCLPPTLLPPPPLPPPATTMASVVAPSPPVYAMPRVFGPFPPLPRKSVSGCIALSMWLSEGQPLYPCSGAPQRPSWAHSSGSQNFVYKQQNPFVEWVVWQWIKQIKGGAALVEESGWWLKSQSSASLASVEQSSPKCTGDMSKDRWRTTGPSLYLQSHNYFSLWVSFSTVPSEFFYRALPNCQPLLICAYPTLTPASRPFPRLH